MATYISLPWSEVLPPPPIAPGYTWDRRPVDWGLSPTRARLQHVLSAFRTLWRARRSNVVYVCHAGMDAVVIGLAGRVLGSKRFVAVDFLLPPRTPRAVLRLALRGFDRFVVIRSGDVETLTSLGVSPNRCKFVKFIAPDLGELATSDDGYVYSGGAAQRDWATLAAALEMAKVPAVVSCPEPQEFSDNVQVLGLLKPDEGRTLMARARFVVQALHDNAQPSGPLLLLDSFALAKPVVASDVRGTRDYVRPGVNGVLVPPANAKALAEAIRDLFGDSNGLRSLSLGASASVSDLTPGRFWSEVFT